MTNVVPVFAVTEVEDPRVTAEIMKPVIELTMPFYERGSVCDAFARGERFSVGEARRIVTAGLRGLAELHERYGILHRDVKTPNLFLDEATVARLGDLSAAARMDEHGTAEAINAPQVWTPPENYVTGRLDRRSDVYSMGVVLHEVLHGPLPYHRYTPTVTLPRLAGGWPAVTRRDLRVAACVPRALRRAPSKAMNLDPSARYESALQMADALAAAVLIDWQPVGSTEDTVVWEGCALVRRGASYRVTAEWMPRRRVWRVMRDSSAGAHRHTRRPQCPRCPVLRGATCRPISGNL